MPAGFRLPPCVHNRATTAANGRVIPEPRFRIDWLADRAEHFQAAQVVLFWFVSAVFILIKGKGVDASHSMA